MSCPTLAQVTPDSKVHGANMGPIWGRHDPGGPHAGPNNFAIWDGLLPDRTKLLSEPILANINKVFWHSFQA